MRRQIGIGVMCGALVLAGCAGPRAMSFRDCALVATAAGALAGAGAGAGYAEERDSDANGDAVGIGIGTFAGTALIGLGVCWLLDREPAEEPEPRITSAAPTPPPAPAPAPRPPAKPSACEVPVTLEGVQFTSASHEIGPGAAQVLRGAVEDLQSCPEARIRVEAHTDSQGSDAYNQALSERRARSVVDFLVRQGVASGRLEPRGFGEARPAADNSTPDGRARNRRVELHPIDR